MGSGSLRSSHKTKSRPKFVFVFGAENGPLGYFRLFSFSAENGISFSSAFSFTAENEKNASLVGLYIKLFHITSYVNDFQTFSNPGSGQLVGSSKN